jgi:hypothetical protein
MKPFVPNYICTQQTNKFLSLMNSQSSLQNEEKELGLFN